MSKEFNHIDDIFKKSFEHASMPAPKSALSSIQSQLAIQTATTTTTVVSTFKIVAFASVAVISIGALVYLSFQKSNSKPPIVEPKVAAFDTLNTPANAIGSNIIGGSQPNGDAPQQILVKGGNSNVANTTGVDATAVIIGKEALKTKQSHNQARVELVRSILMKGERSVNSDSIISVVPLLKEVNAVSKASPEEKNDFKHGATASKICKGRFQVDLDGEVAGAYELALGIQGQTAQYDWGCGREILGSVQGKEANWKGPIYVKKSQELNFWVRAHFMDGCRDTVFFSRWFVPVGGMTEEVFPSVFTPNGDGFNDSFYVMIPTPKAFDILVMDMRGSRVYSSQNPSEKWSGYLGNRKCEKGIYKVLLRRKYFGQADFDTRNFTVEIR
jgi:hypothetical protein